jgi:hypothetical protein
MKQRRWRGRAPIADREEYNRSTGAHVQVFGVSPETLFDGHCEPRCGNVPLTRTPNTTRYDAYAPQTLASAGAKPDKNRINYFY